MFKKKNFKSIFFQEQDSVEAHSDWWSLSGQTVDEKHHLPRTLHHIRSAQNKIIQLFKNSFKLKS